ncbi:MAG: 50S ribosomal protein L29 [Candidatus Zapsychrus exili]|nr:50S ribosomal protein L29 [Candidatus Zapsychrus exili]
MKIKDLKELTKEELIQKEKTFKKELFDLSYQRKMGAVEKPARFKMLKKDIARILTILREREIEDARSDKETK